MKIKANQVLTFGLLVALSGCDNKTETTGPEPQRGSIVLIDPDTGKLIKPTPCTTGANAEKASAPVCDIYRELFRTEDVEVLTIINSIRPDNTKCCTTVVVQEGWALQYCYKKGINRCESGFRKIN